MAVRALNHAVLAMWDQFGPLVAAHSAAGVHRLFLGFVVSAGSLGIFALNIPPTIRVGNYMMFFSRHNTYPLCALGQQFLQPSASL